MDRLEFRRKYLAKYQQKCRDSKDERFSLGETDGTFAEYTNQEMLMDVLERLERLEGVLGVDKE